jgi:GR25 family glycosyltransferase involved in LPS biosynthesis
MAVGRHDHMQIGTPEMLACLLGHMRIWRDIRARGLAEALVLEEDAFIDETSAQRMVQLRDDVAQYPYDVLLLEHGHITVSGAERAVGVLARAWAVPDDARQNRWMGTRGYLVRASAIPRLLRHAATLDVQVDAVLNLAAVFDGLRMVWTSQDIAQPSRRRLTSMTQTYDPCLKCFISPDSSRALAAAIALFMLVCAGVDRWRNNALACTSPPVSLDPPAMP